MNEVAIILWIAAGGLGAWVILAFMCGGRDR